MPFYLNYIIFIDPNKKMGHAAIGITEYNPPNPPKILFRVGLLRPHQVMLEDFMKQKENRQFFHKTYPISLEELAKCTSRINADRRLQRPKNESDAKKLRYENRNPKNKNDKKLEEKEANDLPSMPGGPSHNWITFNCKSYALSVADAAGVFDPELRNFGIDIPIFSGSALTPLTFHDDTDQKSKSSVKNPILVWDSPFVISKRSMEDYNHFNVDELASHRDALQSLLETKVSHDTQYAHFSPKQRANMQRELDFINNKLLQLSGKLILPDTKKYLLEQINRLHNKDPHGKKVLVARALLQELHTLEKKSDKHSIEEFLSKVHVFAHHSTGIGIFSPTSSGPWNRVVKNNNLKINLKKQVRFQTLYNQYVPYASRNFKNKRKR